MLLGYLSDENYVAISDAAVELLDARTGDSVASGRSSASGRVEVDVPPGKYVLVVSAPGFGAKQVPVCVEGPQVQFRLLSRRPYGFVWPKHIRAGRQAELCVSSPDPYRMSLWRYGKDRELVADLGFGEHEEGATAALLPDGDISREGVDWRPLGFPGQSITAPDRSGLYLVHVQTDAGAETSFPWIVAPAQPSASLAVFASDLTWNAYNAFGGRSNYVLPGGLPDRPLINRRQDLARYRDPDAGDWEAAEYPPLSFRRPEPDNAIPFTDDVDAPISTRAGTHLAAADWRLLCWLERSGFTYDLYAESQLHRGEVPLDSYTAVVLGCHPEYWTWSMFTSVRAWVDERGGRLAYLGGNGLNCEVEMLPDDAMLVHNGDTRELGPITGPEWSRFTARREPEAALLGVGYDARGLLTAAPYEVVDAGHWAFAGTNVAPGSMFGTASQNARVPGGASGHETDKISPHSPAGTRLLARGLNADGGGAEIAYHESESGGAVFAAGSVAFVTSLLVDPIISRVTANILNHFLS